MPRKSTKRGYAVFVSAAHKTGDVFVAWCPAGTVDALVESVRQEYRGVEVIDFAPATQDAFDAWLAGVASERSVGRWFARTPKFSAAMPLNQELAA